MSPSPEELAIELEKLREQVAMHNEHLAYLEKRVGIDDLTGAHNRLSFSRELEESLRVIRHDVPEHRVSGGVAVVSLISLDLDHFKKINDTYGHPAGDAVLRGVSLYLMDSVRDQDLVARMGGEEFMILLRGASQEVAARLAERFRAHIEEMRFAEYPELRVTASFGVISSAHSTDAKELQKEVDTVLYEAKEGGRNRVVVYKKT